MGINKVPNLFIVGAAKAATTSVYKYLRNHDEVFFPDHKEPNYLSRDYKQFPHQGPGDLVSDKECIDDEVEYFNLFKNRNEKIIGEASVDYLYYYKTADKIFELNNEAKIVICLRNPMDRAFSAYWHLVSDGRETLSFEEALNKEDERINNNFEYIWHYKTTGLYYEQVKYYIEKFGQENVYLLVYEDFAQDPHYYINDVLEFLNLNKLVGEANYHRNNPSGVPKNKLVNNVVRNQNVLKSLLKRVLPVNFRQELKAKILNKNLTKPDMKSETRKHLLQYYMVDIEKLENLTSLDLKKWLL
ncbi:sulfotransferase family protein [Virgibacillus ihumii]|uniref:sulfotransferase family protein n=1 Tax=Virgibacillus ihumii TaxID=2686091 RepID=UPI00157BE7BB|nr:sulfotransferase [Virgibacillus ihumii]